MGVPPISAMYQIDHDGALAKYADVLGEIPGVRPWKRGVVIVPRNATKVVHQLLKREKVRKKHYNWRKPQITKVLEGPAALVDRLAALGEVDPWTYRDFADKYQLVEAAKGCMRGGGHVWASPGSGKTLIAILWMLAVCRGPVLVVTVAVARMQFAGQISRFAPRILPLAWKPRAHWRKPDVRCNGLHSRTWTPCTARADWDAGFCDAHANQRRPGWLPSGEPPPSPDDLYAYLAACAATGRRPVVVVGWEQMRDNSDLLIRALKPQAVVFDESHMGKAPKRSKWDEDDRGKPSIEVPLHNISAHAFHMAEHVPFRLGMTATPGDDRLIDLWGQLTLVEPQGWGRTVTRFAARYCDSVNTEYGWSVKEKDGSDGKSNEVELDTRIKLTTPEYSEKGVIVRRIPYGISHANLPPLRRQVIHIDEAAQDAPMPGMLRELKRLTKAMERGDKVAAGQLIELRLSMAAERKRTATIKAVLDYMLVGKGKVLVFTGRKRLCTWLEAKLEKRVAALGGQILVITGDTPDHEVERLRVAYAESDGPCVLLGTYQKIGTSIDGLQDSDAVVWQMIPHKTGLFEQGEGRGDRKGRTRFLEILYLFADGTIDAQVLNNAVAKLKSTEGIHAGSRLDTLGAELKALDDPAIFEGLEARLMAQLMDAA